MCTTHRSSTLSPIWPSASGFWSDGEIDCCRWGTPICLRNIPSIGGEGSTGPDVATLQIFLDEQEQLTVWLCLYINIRVMRGKSNSCYVSEVLFFPDNVPGCGISETRFNWISFSSLPSIYNVVPTWLWNISWPTLAIHSSYTTKRWTFLWEELHLQLRLAARAFITIPAPEIQCSCSGWPTGNGKKLSNSQTCCLSQLCLAAA